MNKISDKEIRKHILFKILKDPDLPTVVFFGGIHGNEKAGIYALKSLRKELNSVNQIKGNIYAIVGNTVALKKNARYIDQDLNRIWTKKFINKVLNNVPSTVEEKELRELFNILQTIINQSKGPLYFIDLHTTSGKTIPFITINDSLINRKFSNHFPTPVILGLEEHLLGPMLSYINKLGYVSIGFESGQHVDGFSNLAHLLFCKLVLELTEISSMGFKKNRKALEKLGNGDMNFYEIKYLYSLSNNESFKMKNGYKSFQSISKDELLATSNNNPIKACYKGKIFMPLYQKKGNEGFFIIKKINKLILICSVYIRQINIFKIIYYLPTVKKINNNQIIINPKLANIITANLFHLFGFRILQWDKKIVRLISREYKSKKDLYKKSKWYKNI